MNKNIKPTKSHIVVELETHPEKVGSIHIPGELDKGKTAPIGAKVLALNEEDVKDYPIIPGERVLVPMYGGLPVDAENRNIRVYKIDNVLGVIGKEVEVGID